MTLSLIPRPTRIKHSHAKATRQLIVFTLRQQRFALPIQVAKKVIIMGNHHSYTPDFNTNLVLFQNQEVSIINAEERIFCDLTQPKLLSGSTLQDDGRDSTRSNENPSQHYLLVVQNLNDDVVGLPIATQPTLQLAPESAFTPLSSTYLTNGGLQCVSAMIAIAPDEPPIFLLNLDQLIQPQFTQSQTFYKVIPGFAAET